MLTNKRWMSSRTKIIVSFALFAPIALLLLTGPSPAAVLQLLDGAGHVSWPHLRHSDLTFSLVADGLAWLICLIVCVMVVRLAQHLRDRVPFGMTAYILALFVVCFGVARLAGYALLWGPLRHLEPSLQMIRAAASVVVAMGVAVLFPYVGSMIRAVTAANKEHEQFVAAAESSLDAFYIFESVRDEDNDILDFRFTYVNANGEKRLRIPRNELIGQRLSDVLPYLVTTGILEKHKQVVQSGIPFTNEHLVVAGGYRTLLDCDAGRETG